MRSLSELLTFGTWGFGVGDRHLMTVPRAHAEGGGGGTRGGGGYGCTICVILPDMGLLWQVCLVTPPCVGNASSVSVASWPLQG